MQSTQRSSRGCSRCANQIARRARDCGRTPESVKLVAVSKTFSADEVWPTIAIAGQTRFGENRVQEAIPKWRDLRARAAALGKAIELHLIGPLQSNKAREAIETFDVIETVDREKIAMALAREIDRVGKRPRLFVEVNTGGEPQKAGVLPEDADAFIALCRETYGLTIEGLMAIPPADEPVSPHFALLARHCGTQWIERAFYGHERGLAACGAARRHVCARRVSDFRGTRFTSLKRESGYLLRSSIGRQLDEISTKYRH